MKVLAIVPARSGSKGVKDKNVRMLGDKPLLAYSISVAKQSKLISELVISTDSEEYAQVARAYGAEVPFLRPEALSTDKAASIDVIIHVLEFYQQHGKSFDAVCLLQPTSPFRPVGLVDQAIEQFVKTNADALVSVLPVPHEYNPHWTFEPNAENMLHIATGEADIIKRRQDLPTAYYRDGSIYITKSEVILEKRSLYGSKLSYIVNDPAFYVNIDTENDWLKAEEKLKTIINLIPA